MKSLNMDYLPQIIFVLLIVATAYLLSRRIGFIRRNIQLGKATGKVSHKKERWKNMLLIAFGQKKMFKRPLVGLMHFIIYAGFLIINIEVLEIVLDGILGTHRLFKPLLGAAYSFFINVFEFFALGVITTCMIFLIRRNILRVKRFHNREMTKWPKLDGNLILIAEILLMLAFLSMNASDQVLQSRGIGHYIATGDFLLSNYFVPVFDTVDTNILIGIERGAWWFHIVGIMAFTIYITYSKHLHIALAFPNTFYAKLESKGKMKNMPVVTNEVKMMLGVPLQDNEKQLQADEVGRFGVKDVNDLTNIQLLSAYTCTECGRCTSECPANLTGKLLSPRKIMMDTRDRMEAVGRAIVQGKTKEEALASGNTLYSEAYISKEEIMACTACNACVEACPVNIDPLSIILDIRRFIAMEESSTPASWNMMFSNLETNSAPWKFAPSDRANWINED